MQRNALGALGKIIPQDIIEHLGDTNASWQSCCNSYLIYMLIIYLRSSQPIIIHHD